MSIASPRAQEQGKSASPFTLAENWIAPWEINGTNALSFEWAGAGGDETLTPYPESGGQYHNDFSLQVERSLSDFEAVNGEFSGSVQNNVYRGSETGFLMDRAYIGWEKGDAKIPFRLRGGDFFAYTTRATLQTSLKGVRAEFQPELAGPFAHSIMVFSGDRASRYKDFLERRDIHSGASWLMENEDQAINFSLTHFDDEGTSTVDDRTQFATSIAASQKLDIAEQQMTLSGEVAYFNGDHSVTQSGDQVSRQDHGIEFQLDGRANKHPFDWALVYENYGRDYQAEGASITPGRQKYEARGGWRFESGPSVRVRAQHFRNNASGGNPSRTRVAGLDITGLDRLLPSQSWTRDLTWSFNSFVRDTEDENDTSDTLSRAVRTNVGYRLSPKTRMSADLFFDHQRNHNTGVSNITREIDLSLARQFSYQGFQGRVAPGINARKISGGGNTRNEFTPSLNLNLYKDNHNFSFSHELFQQDVTNSNNGDSLTRQTSLTYDTSLGAHDFQLRSDYFKQDPKGAGDGESFHVMATWRFNFNKPAERSARPDSGISADLGALENRDVFLTDLYPGMAWQTAQQLLDQSGAAFVDEYQRARVYEYTMFEDIQRRQEIVLETRNQATLSRSGVLLELRPRTDIESVERVFQDVRENLLARFGSPVRERSSGDFGPNLSQRITSGAFLRVLEWPAPQGIIRMGITAPVGQAPRLEIIYASDFPPLETRRWGFRNIE